jgi:Family of unknown function (DUF6481)
MRMEMTLMTASKDGGDFNERLSTATKARQATLEKFRARPRVDDPATVERQAARLATSQARDACKAGRAAETAARTARLQEEAIHIAAEEIARKAAAEAENAANKIALEAERKSARDARYAARKARQR